ncbi:MAG: protein-glutamate O-methyltransferase CheR, partial [Elusimicrobia bacterium]|nr:protein-glutamate O-methyltransferase CheR [Elusimicrobiota bacterium]
MQESDSSWVAAFAIERTGIVPTSDQLPGLAAFLRKRFAALGCASAEHYAPRLSDPAELRALAARLTVPETSFFRFPPLWDALRTSLLPGFLRSARAQARKVRVWSAGCCTGEEPYTAAILAEEAGCQSELEILATDLNEEYLERAMTGVFSPRSVRGLPPGLLEKHFQRQGRDFRLNEALRKRVRFERLNLADACFPSDRTRTAGLDMIFCQNVLIYFETRKADDALLRFRDCLRAGGALALGPSEIVRPGGPFVARDIGGAFFHLRRVDEAKAAEPPPPRAERRASPPAAPKEETGQDPASWLEEAERLADLGRRAEAETLCRRACEARHLDPKTYYLLGLLASAEPAAASA